MTTATVTDDTAIVPANGSNNLVDQLNDAQFRRMANTIATRGQQIEAANAREAEDDRTLFDLAFLLNRDASRLLAQPGQVANLRGESQQMIVELNSAAMLESDPGERQKFRAASNYLARGLEDLPVLEGAYNRLSRVNISATSMIDSLIDSASDINLYRRIRGAADVGPDTPIDEINEHILAARQQLNRFAALQNSKLPSVREAIGTPSSALNTRINSALAQLDDAQARLNDPAERNALDIELRRTVGIDEGINQAKQTIDQTVAADPRAAVLKDLKILTLIDQNVACGNPVEDLPGSLKAYDSVMAIRDLHVVDGKASLDRVLTNAVLTSGMPAEQLTELTSLRETLDKVDTDEKRANYALDQLGLRNYISHIVSDSSIERDAGDHYLYNRLGFTVVPAADGTINLPTKDEVEKAYTERRRLLQHAATSALYASDPDTVSDALEALREAKDQVSKFSLRTFINNPDREAQQHLEGYDSNPHSNANWLSRSVGNILANDKLIARAGTGLVWGVAGAGVVVGAWALMACVPGMGFGINPVDLMGSVLDPIAGGLGIPNYLVEYAMVYGMVGGVLAPLGGFKAAGYLAPKVAGEVISIYRNKTDNVIELLKQEFTEPERVATKLSEYRRNLAELLGVAVPSKKHSDEATQITFLDIDLSSIHPKYRSLFELHRKICLLESQVFIGVLETSAKGAISLEQQKPDGERDLEAVRVAEANLQKIKRWQADLARIKAESKFNLTEEDGSEKEVEVLADDLRGKWSEMVQDYSIFSSIKPNVQGQKRKDYDLMRQLEAAMRAEQSALRLASQWAQQPDPLTKHSLVQRMKNEATEVIRNAKEGAGPDTNMQIFNHRERAGAAGALWAFTQGPFKKFGPPPKQSR